MPFCMCAKPDDWHMLNRELGIKLFTLTLIICVIGETETLLGFHRESDITKERIQKILAAGANVILTTGGIDDMCLKYFVDVGAMAVRRVLKRDLKRIAKATGGKTRACCSFYIYFGFSYTLKISAFFCIHTLIFSASPVIDMFFFSFSAVVCPSLTNLEGEETFEATMLGQAEEVVQERVCDDELILVKK